ncbi:MAG: PHB depolymerase family esterase, partial [Myxococcota bacterium]|nr:PHB depolymerase family esterase [Myxococcota bacterium]
DELTLPMLFLVLGLVVTHGTARAESLEGAGRPASVALPEGYDGTRELPLVLQLHGYGMSGRSMDRYVEGSGLVTERDFILVMPEGRRNPGGKRFWNATEACCDIFRSGVDDQAYLLGLIAEAKERYSVDAGRVYLVGYSNGGFMSHTLACQAAGQVTALVSLAGSTHHDETACTPTQPVAVLQVHGTDDRTVRYEGGRIWGKPYPGAEALTTRWASLNGCGQPVSRGSVDLLGDEQAETDRVGYQGCPELGQVQLWTMNDQPHYDLSIGESRLLEEALDFLFAFDRTPPGDD